MWDRLYNDTAYLIRAVIISTATLAAIYGIYHVITYRANVNARVISIGWDTKIDVYRWQTNNHGGWYIPDGGRETNHYTKQRGTRRVPNGTERVCTGSGKNETCTYRTKYRNEPVYDTWYEYDIEEWTQLEPLTNKGTDHTWSMPDTTEYTWYVDNSPLNINDLRQGTYYTHFYVIFVHENKQYPVDMIESMWQEYDIEDSAILTLDWFNNVKAVKKSDWG